jgi:hypothetical protein
MVNELNDKIKKAVCESDSLDKLSEKEKVQLLVKLGAIKRPTAEKAGIKRTTYFNLRKGR